MVFVEGNYAREAARLLEMLGLGTEPDLERGRPPLSEVSSLSLERGGRHALGYYGGWTFVCCPMDILRFVPEGAEPPGPLRDPPSRSLVLHLDSVSDSAWLGVVEGGELLRGREYGEGRRLRDVGEPLPGEAAFPDDPLRWAQDAASSVVGFDVSLLLASDVLSVTLYFER